MSTRFSLFGLIFVLLGVSAFGAGVPLTHNKAALSSVQQQATKCRGVVKDDAGEPLPGASVVLKGTTNGTITDIDGNFSLENVAIGDLLQISYIGFETQEVRNQGEPLTIVMVDDSHQIGEVVVTALGIKRESKKLGYAVSTISAKELVKTGTPNFATSLYGKAAGVRIQAAPGGSTSAVSINVRGISSITGSNEPLVIVDGVPIRNGDANNKGYWDDQHVNSNGLVDINPEDIESLSILKGASASALYGSEAANGVVMITTKSGTDVSGLGVDFSANMSWDMVAYMPEFQTTFGPGVRVGGRNDYEKQTGGFWEREYKGQKYKTARSGQTYYGPKYDGSEVLYWDGKPRAFSPIHKNPWKDVFRTGFNQSYNLSISQGGKKGNTRFSYTYVDNVPTQHNSDFNKHNFNLSGRLNMSERLRLDYTANYIMQNIKNRPYRISRITNNFGGMFGPFEDISLMKEMMTTSLGYFNVTSTNKSLTPDESFAWGPSAGALISEYFWNIEGKERVELYNRLISSVTPSFDIIPGLTLRGRVSTDLTAEKVEAKDRTSSPIVFGSYTGAYGLTNKRYEIYYGDVMLMFDRALTEKIGLTSNVGWQGRIERQFDTHVSTRDGLSIENWFHLNASKGPVNGSMTKRELLKTAMLATLSLSYDDYLFVEGTVRREKSSTLAPGNNNYVYPSVNGSFIFTELLKDQKPSWYDYGKVRVAYGIVGNAPEIYKAVQSYNQQSVSGYIYNSVPTNIGNDGIRPEETHEFEVGFESKFFNNRLGFEISYFNKTVKDQILETTMPQSAGASSILLNIGELQGQGFELSLYGTPIQSKDWRWDLRANISTEQNRVNKLAEGLDVLVHQRVDNGAMMLESHVGGSVGDLYSYAPQVDGKGNKIVDETGLYKLTNKRVKVGNAMPKAVGGLISSLVYRNLFLDATIDFRIGGSVLNLPYQYWMGRGSLQESMPYRDAANGGLSYYFEGNDHAKGDRIATSNAKGPNGEIVYDNGRILPGVKEDGTPNDIILEADKMYNWSYNWGYSQGGPTYYSHSIFDNTYVKLRELSLGYNLPRQLAEKLSCKNLSVSLYGRNLFYLYKNLPIFDAEATDGTRWESKVVIGGSTATTRTFGFSLRASF